MPNTPEPRCRLACRNDFSAIARLRWQLKTDDGRSTIETETETEFHTRYLDHLRREEAERQTCHFVIEKGTSIIGVATIKTVPKEPSPGRPKGAWAYLTNVYLLPSHRNRGLGSEMLDTAKNWATEKKLEFIIVWPSDRSYPFYECSGYGSGRDPLILDLA